MRVMKEETGLSIKAVENRFKPGCVAGDFNTDAAFSMMDL
jgi:hypothetical protein